MQDEADREIRERLGADYSLPCLSPIAMKLVEAASDDQCSAGELESWIEKDPALAVRLIRLANSVALAAACRATTLRQAIFRVGTRRLRIMALSLSVRDTFPFSHQGALDYQEFWRVSVYRALLSRSMAGLGRAVDPEEAFLAGLLSEIGLLVFNDLFVKDRCRDARLDLHREGELLAWERERFGLDHRRVGAAVLARWGFPGPLVDCQAAGRADLGRDGPPSLRAVCAAACELSALILGNNQLWEDTFELTGRSLGVSQQEIIEVLVSTFGEVQAISEALEVQVNREKDLVELLLKANATLAGLARRLADCQSPEPPSTRPDLESLMASGRENGDSVRWTLEAVSHQIRNPLMVVGGFVRRLAQTVAPSSREGKYMRIIMQETGKLERAMQELSRGL